MAAGIERICVVIGRTRHKMIQAEMREAGRRGATLIEIRMDFLAKAPDFKRLLEEKPCPLVATVRRAEDGGRWTGDEAERQLLLRQAIVAGFDWVDLETDVADRISRFRKVKRIVSYHNTEEVPSGLEKIYARMCQQDADVIKVAVTAQHPSDNLRVLDLLKTPPRPTVAFCMGEMGFPSRILAARSGAPFAYAAFNKERRVALGIPSFDELRGVYRYQNVGPDTQVYGVIGDPVAHSLSPLLHNRAFRALGLNAVYLPFQVPPGELPEFLKGFDRFPVRGYSVTIPQKEAALAAAKTPDVAASLVGAANTLVRQANGFAAYNTDFTALRDSLVNNLRDKALAGRPLLVLGAGGVGRAAAHALHREGALVTVTNRTLDRAQRLAQEVGCRFVPWGDRHHVSCSVLVNCTSVGMHPNVDEMPVHPSYLVPEMTVFDTVYTPENTLLIKEARGRGCQVITGVDMFVRQAEEQFRHFTGLAPPADLMRSQAARALSPIALPEEEP